jgi:hypothetical protein
MLARRTFHAPAITVFVIKEVAGNYDCNVPGGAQLETCATSPSTIVNFHAAS